MRRLPTAITLFTALFFIFSLTGNVLIADPTFSSSAFAKDKDNDKNKLKGNKRLREAVQALQEQVDTIELTPGPQGDPGLQGLPGTDGEAGATGATGATGLAGEDGGQGLKGDTGDTGPRGIPGVAGTNGAEISGQLDPCTPDGGLGILAHIPGRSFSVRLPFSGDFTFSHIPAGTHAIVFEANGNVIGTLPAVVAAEGQTTDVGIFTTPFCLSDADGDGFTGAEGDCDNNRSNVYPGAQDLCGDNIDNNCDGFVETNCVDLCDGVALTQSCATGEPGVCSSGLQTRTCSNNITSPWRPCGIPSGTKTAEICVDGLDNNCNGYTDELCGECLSIGPFPDVCGSACVNFDNDPNHCGGCNIRCAAENICRSGACVAPTKTCSETGEDCSVVSCSPTIVGGKRNICLISYP